mgnify:CR=1 FL=1
MGPKRRVKVAASAVQKVAEDAEMCDAVDGGVETAVAVHEGAVNDGVEGERGAEASEVASGATETVDVVEAPEEDNGERKQGDKGEGKEGGKGEAVDASAVNTAEDGAEEPWVVEDPKGTEEVVEIHKTRQILMHGEHKYVQLHPSRFDMEANKVCNYRELLHQGCMEFKNLKHSMESGWSPHNMGTFVYAKEKDGTIKKNEKGEYLFCAPDGQHRAMCQV